MQVDRTTVFEGEGATATSSVTDQNGRFVDSFAPVIFSSGNPGVAGIHPVTGAIVGVSAGTTWLYATTVDPSFIANRDSVLFTVQRRPVATVRVGLSGSSLPEGYSATLTAVPLASNGDTLRNRGAPTFVSSDTTVIRTGAVSGSATTITAVSPGVATVSAAIEGVSGTQSVTVTPAAIATVRATLTPTTVRPGGRATLTVTVTDTGGLVVTSGAAAITSSNTTVATISVTTARSATVTGVAPGTAIVRAAFRGVTDSTTLQVTPTTASSIQLRLTNPQQPLYPTRSATLTATPLDSTGSVLPNRQVAFILRSPAIASVAPAPVGAYTYTATGLRVGSTYLIARADSAIDSLRLQVLSPPLRSVRIDPPSTQLDVGQTANATVTGVDVIGGSVPNPAVSWTSSTPTVAGVSSTGLVTGVAPGTTRIIAAANDSVADSTTVTVVSGTNLRARFVATGEAHTVVIDTSGIAYAAGRNNFGQLGRGVVTNAESTFVAFGGGDRYKQVSLGSHHSALLTTAGVVKTTGLNFAGQLGDGTFSSRSAPVTFQMPEPAVRVRAGGDNTCAIGANTGRLYCAGHGAFGQLGSNLNNEHTPQAVWTTSRVLDVSIGSGFMCLVAEPTTVACRGRNLKRQIDNTGANVTSWVSQTVPAQSGAGAVSWTLPSFAQSIQLADNMATTLNVGHESWCWAPWQQLVIGGRNTQIFCQGDNQLRDVSDNATTPVYPGAWREVPIANFGVALPGVELVRRGFTNTQVLASDGTLLGVGYNFFGQLGNGAFANTPTWVAMAPGRRFRKLAGSAQAYHSCAIDDTFTAWCWGRNDDGQLGINTRSVRETNPVLVKKP